MMPQGVGGDFEEEWESTAAVVEEGRAPAAPPPATKTFFTTSHIRGGYPNSITL